MAPRRSFDQLKLVLHMYKRGNSYFQISVVLGIFQSNSYDIVRRFTTRVIWKMLIYKRDFKLVMNVVIVRF